MIHKNCSNVSVIHALDGSISRFFITANSIYLCNSKIFGNKQWRASCFMLVQTLVLVANLLVYIEGENVQKCIRKMIIVLKCNFGG